MKGSIAEIVFRHECSPSRAIDFCFYYIKFSMKKQDFKTKSQVFLFLLRRRYDIIESETMKFIYSDAEKTNTNHNIPKVRELPCLSMQRTEKPYAHLLLGT